MDKKDLNEDILSGGSISDSAKKKDKSLKKAEKLEKKAKKADEKRASLENKIKELKEQRDSEADDKKAAAIDKKLSSARNKLDVLNGKKTRVASDTAKTIKSVVAVVVVIALLVAYVGTGMVRKGFVHSVLQWTTNLTAVELEDGDGNTIKIPVSTFNYYFSSTYNNLVSLQSTYETYGIELSDYNLDVDFDEPLSNQTTTNDDGEVVTWLEYIYEQVLESIKSTYMYYYEAVKANGGEEPEITDDQQEELDEELSELKETAASYGYTLSGYLVQALGKGVTESVYRREAKIAYIAENYADEVSETISEDDYTDEDIEAYRDENIEDYETVSIRIFEADTEDDAIAFSEALASDGSNFTELCVEYSEDSTFYESYYAQDEASTKLYATRAILQSAGYAIATAEESTDEDEDEDSEDEYPGLDWLFSTDRSAGDIYQYSTTVVYVLEPVSVSDAESVSVRHILIAPDTDDDITEATEDEWAEAYETVESILDEFNSGDATETDFAELAEEYSSDTGSSSDGGLYEDILPGQMVDAFESWSLDPSREAGDVAVIQTEYGYHIMYFVGTSGTPIWKVNAESAIAAEDAETLADELEEAYTISYNWFGKCYIEKDTDIDS